MDLLRAMTVFVKVVDTGSLTAAAAECDISATMVGHHLQALEERLGSKLLNRTTRRQSLTDFGKAYYKQCIDILGLIADADTLAQQAQAVPRGRLRVTAPLTFGTQRLMPAMVEFMALHTEVELDLVLSDRVVDLVEDGFEVAIRLGSLPDSSLIAKPLASYRMVICAAPDYIARRGRPVHAHELAGHACLAYAYSARSEWHGAAAEWRMTGPEGPAAVQVSSRIRCDNAQALRQAALAGAGVVMLPEVLLSQDITSGRLVALLPDYEFPSRPLSLVYLRDRRMSPKLRGFIDFIVERFGTDLEAGEDD